MVANFLNISIIKITNQRCILFFKLLVTLPTTYLFISEQIQLNTSEYSPITKASRASKGAVSPARNIPPFSVGDGVLKDGLPPVGVNTSPDKIRDNSSTVVPNKCAAL